MEEKYVAPHFTPVTEPHPRAVCNRCRALVLVADREAHYQFHLDDDAKPELRRRNG